MRKPYLLLLLLLPFLVKGQTTYKCVNSGDWGTVTGPTPTWSPSGTIPGGSDTVIIGSGFTVTQISSYQYCAKLIIENGGTLNNSGGVVIRYRAINFGTWIGGGNCEFIGTPNDTVLEGGGTNNNEGNWQFLGPGNTGGTVFIGPTVKVVKTSGDLFLETANWHKPVRVVNYGTIEITEGLIEPLNGSPAAAVSWVQGPGSTLEFCGNGSFPVVATGDTLVADANKNTVIESLYNGSFNITTPAKDYYHLTIGGSGSYTATVPGLITVLGNLTINDPVNFAHNTLLLGGNWIYNGGTLSNMGTVNFNGAATQNVEGTASTTFNSITISGSGSLDLQTNTAFTGTLTLASGAVSLNGPAKMTLISNSGGTGMIAPITGTGGITATFVIQCYDGRTAPSWQTLSTPVQSDLLNDWNASNQPSPATPSGYFYMSGVGGVNGNAENFISVDKFVEKTNAYDPITNFASPGISYHLKQGEGLYIWMANSMISMSPFTYITNGVPNTGSGITIGVTDQNSGWNMIGNPYPCPISWSTFQSHNTSLASTFYIYEDDQTWHPFGAGSNIAMEQGFMVTSFSNTTLSFFETDKILLSTNLLSPGDPTKALNSVTFTLADDSNSRFACPTTITFGNGYSPSYDPNEDALYIPGKEKKVPVLVTYSSDNRNLILNKLPDGATQIDVPMSAICNVPADYTLSCFNTANLSSYQCVCLIDKKTGNILNNFENNSVYTFSASQAGQEFDYLVRFTQLEPGQSCTGANLLTSNGTAANSVEGLNQTDPASGNYTIIPTQAGADIVFSFPQAEDVIISAYNMLGQKVIDDLHTNVSSNQINIALPQTTGVYAIRVETPTGVTVKKLYR